MAGTKKNWQKPEKIALHWQYDEHEDVVVCTLCHNLCELRESQTGTCGVRQRVDNKLYSLNYGYCVEPVIETIETEAVYHFQPGAKILSMGNIGCNMKCLFCQNWETSQVQHLDDKQVVYLSPQDAIDLAKSNNIKIISWTYNDPVVWHEYVLETSKLAKENGILTLYKSALNISMEAVEELIECIDIFSISLKAMDSAIYKRIMKGSLELVLEGIKKIYQSGKHLEISQLVVTKLNDSEKSARDTAHWILQNCDAEIPLHFVSYHPAYKYFEERSTYELIELMCNTAKSAGIVNAYAGNIFNKEGSNTYCLSCGDLLVKRTGLSIDKPGIDHNSNCQNCGALSPVKLMDDALSGNDLSRDFTAARDYELVWGEYNYYHLLLQDKYEGSIIIKLERYPDKSVEFISLKNGLQRILVPQKNELEEKVLISINGNMAVKLLPLLDRAHYPG